jgi:hypothetical protein
LGGGGECIKGVGGKGAEKRIWNEEGGREEVEENNLTKYY